MRQRMTEIICPHCGNIYASKDIKQSKNLYVCNSCEHKFEKIAYRKFIRYSYDAVKYGYCYRQEYEKQKEKLLRIEPETLLVFCAGAAASGIIGNLSYDFIKYLIKNIVEKYKKNKEHNLNPDIPKTDKEIEIFIQFIKDYMNGLENIDAVTKELILEEIEGNTYESTLVKALVKGADKPKKIRIQIIIEARRKMRKMKLAPWEIDKSLEYDVKQYWKKVSPKKNNAKKILVKSKVKNLAKKTKKKSHTGRK